MAKVGRDKIALFLACASVLGGKASAAQSIKTDQTVAEVGGAAFSNSKAMKKSQKMSSLTKGLIIGGSILGTGLIYEILGDTVINKTPTLLKLIRGQGKYEQVAKENMQKIYKEMNDLTMFKEKGCQQFKERFESFKKEFESIKGLIIGYEINDIWRKISFVLNDDGNMYTTNEEDTKGLSNQKLITGIQKKKFNLKLMKEFDDIFSGKKQLINVKRL